jgi:hypothetical protein
MQFHALCHYVFWDESTWVIACKLIAGIAICIS